MRISDWSSVVFSSDLVDSTRLTVVIIAVFGVGMALAAQRLWRLDQEIDSARGEGTLADSWAVRYLDEIRHHSSGSRSLVASALRMPITVHISLEHGRESGREKVSQYVEN